MHLKQLNYIIYFQNYEKKISLHNWHYIIWHFQKVQYFLIMNNLRNCQALHLMMIYFVLPNKIV